MTLYVCKYVTSLFLCLFLFVYDKFIDVEMDGCGCVLIIMLSLLLIKQGILGIGAVVTNYFINPWDQVEMVGFWTCHIEQPTETTWGV